MKKSLLFLLFLLPAALFGQKAIEIKLWPDGAPNDNGILQEDLTDPDYPRNTREAILYVYPAEKGNGLSVVACPGGGYSILAMHHEGIDMAAWFNSQGITYAVLRYRMPNGHDEVPLSDVHQAIRVMRSHADDWQVKKVGVICNNRYEGSPKAGSVKVPVRDTDVVVNDYDKAKGAKQTSGDTTYLTVNIDHDKAVNEIIDGFDAESVPGNLVADRLDSAGYSLGLQMDSDGSVELTTAGTAFGNTTALTEKTIYANIVDARTQQSSIGVPTAGRWLLVSPDTYGLLLKSPEFIKASDLGDAVVQTGAVGKIAGYTVFEDSTLGENVEYVAGHPNWFAVIDEWAVPVHLQDLSGSGDFIGASAVQGRKVYAYKVTKGQTILVKKKVAA